MKSIAINNFWFGCYNNEGKGEFDLYAWNVDVYI